MRSVPTLPAACRVLTSAAGALLIVSCGQSYIAPPVASLPKGTASRTAQLERGYAIHQLKCAKCHAFEDPRKYGVNELRTDLMPVMVGKAKLSPADSDAVLAYVLAAREMTVR